MFFKTLGNFIKLLAWGLLFAFGFWFAGWFMLIPIVLGVLWGIAQDMARKSSDNA